MLETEKMRITETTEMSSSKRSQDTERRSDSNRR